MLRLRRSTQSRLAVALVTSVAAVVVHVAPGSAQSATRPAGAIPPEYVVLPDQAAAPTTPGGPGLVDSPARGLVFSDLQQGAPDGPCAGLLHSSGRGPAVCTHGPDPTPVGVDVRTARSTADLAAATVASTAGVPCYGDGTSGKRVQAVYVHASDVPDRYSSIVGLIGAWAANTDRTVAASAAETGGIRHVRWVTDAGCNLVVERVRLSAAGDDSFSATSSELQALGFNRADRKYLLWVDASIYCGIAGIVPDDRPTADNANNGGPSFARIDTGCWGSANPIEAHELMHNLGGVQLSAPHTSGGWHCTDGYDLMCYADGSGVTMTYACAVTHESLFDCNHDDYFSTAPVSGTYLASHWNAANSAFLEFAEPPILTTTTTTSTTTAPPSSTTTTVPTPPPPVLKTATYSSSLSRKVPSQNYGVVTGAGTLNASVRYPKASTMTLKVLDSAGAVVGQATGPSPVALSVPVIAGTYRVMVSGPPGASYTLTITYPSP